MQRCMWQLLIFVVFPVAVLAGLKQAVNYCTFVFVYTPAILRLRDFGWPGMRPGVRDSKLFTRCFSPCISPPPVTDPLEEF